MTEALIARRPPSFVPQKGQGASVLVSFFMHVAIIVIASISFSLAPKPKINETPPMDVEFVIEQPEKKEAPPKPKTVEKPVPVKSETPPPPVLPKEKAPEAKPVPPAPEKVKPKPEPAKPKPPEPEPEKVVKEQPKAPDFSSVLKNLVGEDRPVPVSEAPQEAQGEETPETTQRPALSSSEVDALYRQLAGCWNIVPGARSAENLVVEVHLSMAPDATVKSASIKDISRYNADPFFRAAADAALRAVRNPACTPLKLPLNKYSQWKEVTIRFDPREMF